MIIAAHICRLGMIKKQLQLYVDYSYIPKRQKAYKFKSLTF